MRRAAPFDRGPLVIAHRGACGALPEHTLAAYQRAIDQGAHAIELDVVSTGDGTLIARHENELSLTTDVAIRPQFAERRTTRTVDGVTLTGWFTETFTFQEIQTLRARQRMSFRDGSFDGRDPVPSLDEVLTMVHRHQEKTGKSIAVFIELKDPTYFASIDLPIDTILLQTLARHPMTNANGGIVLQSFEVGILRRLRDCTAAPLMQLVDAPRAAPFDHVPQRDARTFGEMLTPDGLRRVAEYAVGIGAWKRLIVPAIVVGARHSQTVRLGPPSSLISDAHAAGLMVCAWTFRNEPQYLAADYAGDPQREYRQFFELGLDGAITDFPDAAIVSLA